MTAGAAAAFARAAVRFEIASTRTDEIVAAQDVPLSADGALSQFVRATLDLSAASAGDYLARASIVVDGARVGMIDAPLQLAREQGLHKDRETLRTSAVSSRRSCFRLN